MSYILYLSMLLAGQDPIAPAPAAPDGTAVEAPATDDAAAPADGDTEPTEGDTGDSAVTEPGEDDMSDEEEAEDGTAASMAKLKEIAQSGALGLLLEGGWFMLPILIMGILAAGVIIERYRSLKMLTSDPGSVRGDVLQFLREDKVEEALNLCENEQGPVPAILSAGLRKFLVLRRLGYDPAKIEEQVVKAIDDYGVHVVAALEKHLPVLATVSSVAPMLGFLGTVAGMITSFQDIVAQMGETNIVEAAADGISVALLTTAFGLIIGIPAFMAFNYFSSVINRFVLDVEESAQELMEAVTLQMALERRAQG
jgi:biopolymer transport protein ExbB